MIYVDCTKELTLKDVENIFKSLEEECQPYKDLGNGLYKLYGNVITNKKGLELYLKLLERSV